MAIKFAFKNTGDKARKEGDSFVRYSGTGEPFDRDCERTSREVAVDSQGNPTKWRFLTGLDENLVDQYIWFTDEEKAVVKETIKNLKPKIELHYGGAEVINSENYAFWKKRRDVNKLHLTFGDLDRYHDTTDPENALLYLSIIAGAFGDIVAPNKDWAERFQIPHYIALETDSDPMDEDEEITKSDAHGLLTQIRKEFGKEALLILAWCLQYETTGFGGYSYAASEKDLVTYHISYINGKLSSKNKKKNFPKLFIEYAEKWKASQTRPLLFVEAYIKAGEWFNYVNQREKKYVTSDGTILGNTINEAVTNLMKPKFKLDLENLRTAVENKWKE